MTKFTLRYGVLLLLIVILVGVAFILKCYRVNTKASVALFASDSVWSAYVAKPTFNINLRANDTITIRQTLCGDCSFVVVNIADEPANIRMELRPTTGNVILHSSHCYDTYLSGFIYTGTQSVGQMLLNSLGL